MKKRLLLLMGIAGTMLLIVLAGCGGGGGDSGGSSGGSSGVPSTSPVVTDFSLPTSASALTVSFGSLNTNNATAYFLSESSTAPLATATGWTSTKPTSYTFSSPGTKTLFVWVKSASNEVSASKSSSTKITLPLNSIADIVGTWNITSPSSSSSNSFTVNSDGSISSMKLSVSTPSGSCFSSVSGTITNFTFGLGSFSESGSYSYSSNLGESARISVSANFTSPTTFVGTYSASHGVANSFGACNSTGSGSITATKQ